jgi:DNA-binding winged helix-turn-helix (wHTH) protein/tetratricopeptide (TPR) repeat protein
MRPRVLRFSVFEVDLERGELRKSGRRVPLQQQPWRALVLLASQPGRLVSRDELRRAVWPDGTHVDFERGINFCVSQVRHALGDPARASHFIETVPRQGYRFVADVHEVPPLPAVVAPSAPVGATAPVPDPARSGRRRSPGLRWWLFAACAAGLTASGGDVSRPPQPAPPAARIAEASAQAALARVMLEQGQSGARPADEVMPRARTAALAALREDPKSADARVSLALVKLHYDWDWDGEEDVERSLAEAPGLPRAYLARAAYLSARGDHDAAIAAARRAMQLEPLCPTVRGDLGWYFYCARRFPEAAVEWQQSLDILGDSGPRDRLVDAFRQQGRIDEAWQQAVATMRRAGVSEEEIARLARSGPPEALRGFLAGSAAFLARHGASPVRLAALHAAAGQDEQALGLLGQAARDHAWGLLTALAVDPDLARLERHERYRRLLRETGLRPAMTALFTPPDAIS